MLSDLNLPTYEELLQVGLNALPEGTDRSENTFYYPQASSFALMGNELMIALQFVYERMFVDNLTGAELDAYISDRCGLTRRAATRATGTVTFTGNDGILVPQGTKVAAGDKVFVTLYGDTIKGTTVDIDVQAVQVGNIGYVAASTIDKIITQTVGITGVTNKEAMVSGMDEEPDNSYRARYRWYLQHFSYNLNDDTIRLWASEVEGVGQVRVIGSKESRSFVVYALDANFDPASDDIITALQAELANRLYYGFSVMVTAPAKENVPVKVVVKQEVEGMADTLTKALDAYLHTYPDPNWIRNDLTVWEVINVVEKNVDMDNVLDIQIGDGSSPEYTLSATDGSKLLSIDAVTIEVKQ